MESLMLISDLDIVSRFDRPANVGSFDRDDPRIGVGMVGSPDRGEVIRLAVKFSSAGVIIDARFKAFGGPATIAAASLVCDRLRGRTAAEAMGFTGRELGRLLRFELNQMRIASLAEDAIHASIEDYRSRNPGS
jgi:nitrogen fixation NifU-like protein